MALNRLECETKLLYDGPSMMSNPSKRLLAIYETLLAHYGPQGWWPADTPTETIIGAILVQHTAWRNVPPAVQALRDEDLLDFRRLSGCAPEHLAELVRPAGMPRVKARRLLAFAEWLGRAHDFDLPRALALSPEILRPQLLNVTGIGPETADCILLYAAGHPGVVVDGYTRRLLTRHLLCDPDWNAETLRQHLRHHLPADPELLNEFHALMVAAGKTHCRARARCSGCPLEHLEHCVEPDGRR